MITTTVKATREAATARLKARRAFQVTVLLYLSVSSVLVVIWLTTRNDGDFFWPTWVIMTWGIGLIIQGWTLYGPRRHPITEDEIQREMQHSHEQQTNGPDRLD